MVKSKVFISLLMMLLLLNISKSYAEDLSAKQDVNSKPTNALDIESFKKELMQVSTKPETSEPALKGRVKTLSTKYLMSPGDAISISVYGEPEFTQNEILVRPDGYSTIEPFGEVKVAGMDVEELTGVLKDQLKTYLLDPKVSVKVNDLHVAKVYIYGAVQKPGLYQQGKVTSKIDKSGRETLTAPELTIASVISNAGGIKYNANLRSVKIINNETGRNEEVDLMKMLINGDMSQDICLRSGDTIHVPEIQSDAQVPDNEFMLVASSSLAPAQFPVRVIGAVRRPGLQNLTSASPHLNSAIAASEGYTLDANQKVIMIQRPTPQGNISTFYINPAKNDMVLRPNDIVVVPEKATTIATRGFGYMQSVMGPFGGFSSAFNGWAEMFNPTRRFSR